MGLQLLMGAASLTLLSVTWCRKFAMVLVTFSVFGVSLSFWPWFTVLAALSSSKSA
jgi:hypothetical protein